MKKKMSKFNYYFACLPRVLQNKIRLMELEAVLKDREHNKNQGCCGHKNFAQCLSYWDMHYSKIDGVYYGCYNYWNRIKLYRLRSENLQLSTKCATTFATKLQI